MHICIPIPINKANTKIAIGARIIASHIGNDIVYAKKTNPHNVIIDNPTTVIPNAHFIKPPILNTPLF